MTDLVGGQVKQCFGSGDGGAPASGVFRFDGRSGAGVSQFESGFPGGAGRGVGFRGRAFWILQPEGRNWVAVLLPWS